MSNKGSFFLLVILIIGSRLLAQSESPIPVLRCLKVVELAERSNNSVLNTFTLNKQALQSFLDKEKHGHMRFIIPTRTRDWLIDFQEVSPFSKDFAVYNAAGEKITAPAGRHYQFSSADTMATLSIFEDQLVANIFVAGALFSIGKKELFDQEYVMVRNLSFSSEGAAYQCHTEDVVEQELIRAMQTLGKGRSQVRAQLPAIEIYFELDYLTYLEQGRSTDNVFTFFSGLFNAVALLYAREGITVKAHSIKIWDEDDPFSTTSSLGALLSFKDYLRKSVPNQPWDLGVLLSRFKNEESLAPLGGRAGINALCNNTKRHAYANIGPTTKEFPEYSWSIFVTAHEIGHLIASPHTHACFWAGGPIDDCYCSEGNCPEGPSPDALGGTIMSYCYIDEAFDNRCSALPGEPNPGVNFLLGFADQPVSLMKERML